MIKIIQFREKCIGCNACVEASSARWRISRKDGKSVLVGGVRKKYIHFVVVGEDERSENMQAYRNCPARVIQIIQL